MNECVNGRGEKKFWKVSHSLIFKKSLLFALKQKSEKELLNSLKPRISDVLEPQAP